jgi:hypothetical protein
LLYFIDVLPWLNKYELFKVRYISQLWIILLAECNYSRA